MADWRKMSRSERKAAGFPVSEIGAQLFFDRFGVGMGLVDPDARYTSEGPVGVEELLERSSRLDTTDEARAERGFGRSAYRSGLAGPVIDLPRDTSIVRPEEVSKQDLLKETQEARQNLEENQLAPGVFRSSSERRQAENLAEKERRLQNQLASDPDIQRSREDTVMAQPLVPQELSQEQIDKAMSLVKESPDLSFLNPEDEDATPAPDGDTTPAPDGDVTPPPGGGDDKPTKRDLRSRYNDQLALMQEIYGLEDKDEAQERAMSLAMIGLAIAAGQSPNALTNIAQGAMVGLQGMGERRDAARERERGIKTLALQTAIDQQAAEAGAEAEAAKAQFERDTRLMVEREKNRGGSSSSPFEKFPTVADLIAKEQNTIDAAVEENPGIVPEQYKDNPNAWKDLELKRRGKRYVLQSLPQMPEEQRQGLLLAGQELLYQYPEDPSLRIVQNSNDLMFIMPGQKFAQLDPQTREYSIKIKRVDPETGNVTVADVE
jgi:hypothetical protein